MITPIKGKAVNETKSKEDIFGDLLGSQGYAFSSKTTQGPRTINQMRKVELAKDMDRSCT